MENKYENKYQCKICGKKVKANNSYIGSHVKRIHKISLEDYFLKYESEFKNENPLFKKEKRNFCKTKDAKHIFEVDYNNKTFKRYYNGYFCYTDECKNTYLKYFEILYVYRIAFVLHFYVFISS